MRELKLFRINGEYAIGERDASSYNMGMLELYGGVDLDEHR